MDHFVAELQIESWMGRAESDAKSRLLPCSFVYSWAGPRYSFENFLKSWAGHGLFGHNVAPPVDQFLYS